MELIGVRESAGINRLGIRNERVLCYSEVGPLRLVLRSKATSQSQNFLCC